MAKFHEESPSEDSSDDNSSDEEVKPKLFCFLGMVLN